MKKVFIETSVFIRYFTKDDPKKFNDCIRLFDQVEQGKLIPYISNVVIMEIIFVLTGLYGFPKATVLSAIEDIFQMRNLVVVEKTDTRKALGIFKKYNIKYGDSLIATQLPATTLLLSYDSDFSKITSLNVAEPAKNMTC